jgi:PAS domain S-box-containing protein
MSSRSIGSDVALRHGIVGDPLDWALGQIHDYAIVHLDDAGRVARWNRGAEQLLAYSANNVLGKTLHAFFTAEDVTAGVPIRELRTASQRGKSRDERWFQRGDGSRFYGNCTLSAVRDASGLGVGYVAVFRDLTERRRLQEQLAGSEHRYRVLFESLGDCAIFTLDPLGRISDWTQPAERLMGYAASEIVGRPFSTFFTEAGRAERGGWQVRKDGTRFWAEGLTTVMRGPSGEVVGFSKTARDCTDRRQSDLERERRLRQATEGNRLKDEFLSTVSRELRTPLNAILGWMQLLQLGAASAENVTEALAVVERNARAQARLIDDLLEVSRVLSGKARLVLRPIALAAPLGAAIETVRPMAEQKRITLTVHHDASRDALVADAERLQQVIWNLLSNAIKFTPEGGSVVIATAMSEHDVELLVRDSGIGIDRAFLPLVFDRFRQADTSYKRSHTGLGLGLSIVKDLVELHGGRVGVESEGPGTGTTVRLTLPRSGHAQAVAGDESATRGHRTGRALMGVKALVVDDDGDGGQILELVLAAQGAEVSRAASAREAMSVMRCSLVDVVLTDLSMPGDDGFALLHHVRTQVHSPSRPIRVVAVTAHARPEDREKCLVAGFDAFVSKPLDLDHVIDVVAGLTIEP